jgi:hypothetical protein
MQAVEVELAAAILIDIAPDVTPARRGPNA